MEEGAEVNDAMYSVESSSGGRYGKAEQSGAAFRAIVELLKEGAMGPVGDGHGKVRSTGRRRVRVGGEKKGKVERNP